MKKLIALLLSAVMALCFTAVFAETAPTTIESSDGSIARTIIENTKDKNQQIAVLNSIQSVTADQVKSGTTYLSLMQQNYDVLKAHLK